MKASEIKIIELKAGKILTDLGVRDIPVPIESIAERIGIKIGYAPSDEYSGMLIRKEGQQALMGINSDEPKTRMRFTIAHEIAHFIFENKKISIDYRSSGQLLNKPPEEKRADFFASSILMPKKAIALDFDQISEGLFSQEDLVRLAKKYQVSQDAMKYRLINLGLIRPA